MSFGERIYTCTFCDNKIPYSVENLKICDHCMGVIRRYKIVQASKAGSVKSKKKKLSSRKNGKLGGRPRLNRSGLADVVIFLLFSALAVGAVVVKDSSGNNIVQEVVAPQPTPIPVKIVE